jgi:hypothetical protein
VRVNQQSNGGRWNVLGSFSFKSQPKVVVVSENSNYSTCADAVRLVSSSGTRIIDNDKSGTSYIGGPWGYSSGASPYGGSSRAESRSGATYTFTANL